MKRLLISAAFAILLPALTVAGREMRTFVTPPTAGENPYIYLPFDVPAGTSAISVSVEYDKTGSRLDFGLFDSRFSGGLRDTAGFRGWSGAIRDEFFIAGDEATNGYDPGPIPRGIWRLVIGRAQVAGSGIELRVRIDLNTKNQKALERLNAERSKQFRAEPEPVPMPVTAAGMTWYKGDLHAHTVHGDGTWTVSGALESARANGLDFVALTEHNTFSHHAEIESNRSRFPGMLIIRGQEVTTYGGHINVWGLPNKGWIDFRVVPGLEISAAEIEFEAMKFGGLASINHPTMRCGGCSWTYDTTWKTLDSVEIWNATWDPDDESALKMWDDFLKQGRRITAVGSSDSHQPPYESSPYPTNLRLGEPAVFIGSKALTELSLFQAIRAGRVFIASNPRQTIKVLAGTATIGSVLPLRPVEAKIELAGFPSDARLIAVSDGKPLAAENVAGTSIYTVRLNPVKPTYLRFEIRAADGKMLGMTNPIYFK